MKLLEHVDEWDRIVAILRWFQQHPRPGLYLRQLDIQNVHTKFMETRRSLLSELLDIVLSIEAIDTNAVGARAFEQRYGLRAKSPLIRFRLLDQKHAIHSLTDIATPAEQLAISPLPVRRVFITENEINGLAFPNVSDSAVIFGLGYSLERLVEIDWLKNKQVYYWGDIDTHGFAILDRLRATIPHAISFLMDRYTLIEHKLLWGEELDSTDVALTRLTDDERLLYESLVQNRLGSRVRLEQERIAFGSLVRALKGLLR